MPIWNTNVYERIFYFLDWPNPKEANEVPKGHKNIKSLKFRRQNQKTKTTHRNNIKTQHKTETTALICEIEIALFKSHPEFRFRFFYFHFFSFGIFLPSRFK